MSSFRRKCLKVAPKIIVKLMGSKNIGSICLVLKNKIYYKNRRHVFGYIPKITHGTSI